MAKPGSGDPEVVDAWSLHRCEESIKADRPSETSAARILAVVVTMNRPHDLDRLLTKLEHQVRPIERIVIVDNGLLPETLEVVSRHPLAIHLRSQRNLGGAGGFCYGMLHALAIGAEHLWIMDDDGFPENENCLAVLETALDAGGYDMVSPLVLDIEDPDRLAFFYYRQGRPISARSRAGTENFDQFAHLFNGALIPARTIERFGLPRFELFFRGDEVDFMFRLKRNGARFVTVVTTAFHHPSGRCDTLPIMGGRYHAIYPASDRARYYYYRNRGNLVREFNLLRAIAVDCFRYGWAFLITRRGDFAGLRQWFELTYAGWRRSLTPFHDN